MYRHNKDKENTYGLIPVLHTHMRTHVRARALTERIVIWAFTEAQSLLGEAALDISVKTLFSSTKISADKRKDGEGPRTASFSITGPGKKNGGR